MIVPQENVLRCSKLWTKNTALVLLALIDEPQWQQNQRAELTRKHVIVTQVLRYGTISWIKLAHLALLTAAAWAAGDKDDDKLKNDEKTYNYKSSSNIVCFHDASRTLCVLGPIKLGFRAGKLICLIVFLVLFDGHLAVPLFKD